MSASMWPRRRRRSGIGYSMGDDYFSGANSDRAMAPNRIVDNRKISKRFSRFDVFNANNVVVSEWRNGRRLYCEPCPNRRDRNAQRKYNKINKKRRLIEGWI